jgi:hypothetical protein
LICGDVSWCMFAQYQLLIDYINTASQIAYNGTHQFQISTSHQDYQMIHWLLKTDCEMPMSLIQLTQWLKLSFAMDGLILMTSDTFQQEICISMITNWNAWLIYHQEQFVTALTQSLGADVIASKNGCTNPQRQLERDVNIFAMTTTCSRSNAQWGFRTPKTILKYNY